MKNISSNLLFWLLVHPVVLLRLLLYPARMLVGFLTLLALFLNGIVLEIFLVLILDVEPLKETMEVEVLKIVRTQGQLCDDKIDILIL